MPHLAVQFGGVRSVTHEAAGLGELAPKVNGGHRVAGGQRNENGCSGEEEWAGCRRGAHRLAVGQGLRRRRFDFTLGAGFEDEELLPNCARRCLCVAGLGLQSARSG